MFSRSLPTQSVYDQVSARLKTIGLPQIEHYPLPSGTGSLLGRCHRRPCGVDSGVITPGGLVTDPIQQIRRFMEVPQTPPFARIVEQHIYALMRSYRAFLRCGESLDHKRLSSPEKVGLIKDCWQVVEEVKNWFRRGCPIDPDLVRPGTPYVEPSPELYTHLINSTGEGGVVKKEEQEQLSSGDDYPESFWQVDLPRIVEKGQWFQFVRFLVKEGFPAEDTFYDVVSTLAKWFLFVEFFGEDQAKTIEVIRAYVHQNNNGKVSRLVIGAVRWCRFDGQPDN